MLIITRIAPLLIDGNPSYRVFVTDFTCKTSGMTVIAAEKAMLKSALFPNLRPEWYGIANRLCYNFGPWTPVYETRKDGSFEKRKKTTIDRLVCEMSHSRDTYALAVEDEEVFKVLVARISKEANVPIKAEKVDASSVYHIELHEVRNLCAEYCKNMRAGSEVEFLDNNYLDDIEPYDPDAIWRPKSAYEFIDDLLEEDEA